MVLLLSSTRGQYPGVTGPINTDQPKPHVSQKAVYTYTCTVFHTKRVENWFLYT